MSEITPAYSLKPVPDSSSKTATGIDLAPVVIRSSHMLWRMELVFYSLLVGAASIGLFPFFLIAFYWPIVWLVFVVLIVFVLRKSLQVKNSQPVTVAVRQNVWQLKNGEGEFTVVPFGEILLWSWVIILPLRETISGRKHTIVLLQDSVKADDWRHLRVWLRTGLKK